MPDAAFVQDEGWEIHASMKGKPVYPGKLQSAPSISMQDVGEV